MEFLFISGTSLLVLTYKEEEKYRAQGFNDFIVYSVHAIGSLSAGILIVLTNWKMMNIICIPFNDCNYINHIKSRYFN